MCTLTGLGNSLVAANFWFEFWLREKYVPYSSAISVVIIKQISQSFALIKRALWMK